MDEKEKNSSRIVSIDTASRGGAQEEAENEALYEKKVRRHRRRNRLGILLLFAVVIGAMVYLLLVKRKEAYSAIGLEWEQPALTAANQQYMNFHGGILQVGPQGANYFTATDKETWAAGFSMKNPRAICQDGYALVYDQGDKTAVILSAENGMRGTITTTDSITKGTISSYGAVALVQEEALANTIVFFGPDGTPLDIGVHTLVDKSGYPVDIDFSPDGQIVMASCVYVDSGVMKNQIVFYNFDEKRNTTGVVGAYAEYGDTLFADVCVLNDDRAVALGDGMVVVYSLKNKTAPQELQKISFEEEITQVAYGRDGIAVITRNGNLAQSHNLHVYSVDGELLYEQETSFDVKRSVLTENGLYMLSDHALCVLNPKGKIIFSGSLDSDILQLNNAGKENELLLMTNQKAVYLKLFRG